MNNQTTIILKTLTLAIAFLLVIQLSFAQLNVTKIDGNVGIGTETPTEKLDVNGNALIRGGLIEAGANEAGQAILKLGAKRDTDGIAIINMYSKKGEGFKARLMANADEVNGDYTALMHYGTGNLFFRAWQGTSNIVFHAADKPNALTIKPNGNVGIGTTDPQYKLAVNGDVAKFGDDGWTVLSDKRTKKNINGFNFGLAEVLKLNPVSFNYNGKAGIHKTDKTYVGLVAQEFAEIMPDAVSNYTYTDSVTNKTEEYMAINASSIRYMLVNAVKEQQALIESQESQLKKQQTLAETQQAEIDNLKALVADLAKAGTPAFSTDNEMSVLLEGNGIETALLAQNSPNPFTTQTKIEYFIPADSRHCRMSFRDMNGKEIKQVNIEHEGAGAIQLSAKDLAAGIYSYVLYVNGDIVSSKKMIIKE